MGRARIILKSIENESSREGTFNERSRTLMNKVSEFSILSGAEACFIVYDVCHNAIPMTWPRNNRVLHSIIEKYERQKNKNLIKTFDLEDFLDNRKRMVEDEISKKQKAILKVKYPTWNLSFNNLGKEQLWIFKAMLEAKIKACDLRTDMLKNKHQGEVSTSFMQNMAHESVGSFNPSHLNFMGCISQRQIIPAPIWPLNGNSGMVNHVDAPLNFRDEKNMGLENVASSHQSQFNSMHNISQSQIVSALMRLLDGNSGMVNHVDVHLNSTKEKSMALENVASSHSSQFNLMQNTSQSQLIPTPIMPLNDYGGMMIPTPRMPLSDNGAMVDFSYQVDAPLDSTNQCGEPMDLCDLLGEPEDWAIQLSDLDEISNYLANDFTMCPNQPDESVLQNIHFHTQNEQQGASSHAFPAPKDAF